MSAEPEHISPGPDEAGDPIEVEALVRRLDEVGGFEGVEQFWSAVQQVIQQRLGHRRYSLWFHQTELMSFQDDRLVVGVPNLIIQQYLTQRYAEAVQDAVDEMLDQRPEVSFEVAPRLFRKMAARREEERREAEGQKAPAMQLEREPERASVPKEWGFEHLVVTAANRLPVAAAREVAGQRSPRFRFLYICGDYGVGKTALLRATYALASGPETGLEPEFMSAERWCNEYYHAIQRKSTVRFRRRYRACRMLLLDDVQFVCGKAGGQNELLHTVKHILSNGGRVVLAGRPHPERMRDVTPAFQAMLRRAFPGVLHAPDEQELVEVARELARRHGMQATDEALELLAARRGDNPGVLDAAVCCLSLYAGVHGLGRLSAAQAAEALAAVRPASGEPVTIGRVQEAVLEVFDVEPEALRGDSRSRTVLLARQVGMYLARKLTGSSLAEIGRAFGRSSHSTVRHAVDKIEDLIEEDGQMANTVRRLRRRLTGHRAP
ncbi:MAG: DnaA/Hda family protein [Candidatus Brocadiia bacterium]